MAQKYQGLSKTGAKMLDLSEDEDEKENGAATEEEVEDEEKGGPDTQPMSEAEFEAAVSAAIGDAADYIDGYIAPDRALATQYYRGDLLGNEEEGRSQIVMTEVRDVIQAMIPSLLRIFTASEQPVEFEPRTERAVEMAEQATDYVNLVFMDDNPGFQILHWTFKDALKSKIGVIKWRWSEDKEVTEAEFSGLDLTQISLLQQDPETEILEMEVDDEFPPMLGPDGMPDPMSVRYEVKIRRTIEKNRVVIECIPPEEFLIARDARDLDTAAYVGHRSHKTISELVAMGYDRDEVEQYAGQGDVFSINYEAQVRNPAIMTSAYVDNSDPVMRLVLYTESYVRIDKDGDGIAELRKVCSLGDANHILYDEIATDVPFAVFCPDPEPHMIIGQSIADQTMDLQRIKTGIVRNTLDSLAQVIHPRTVVVEGQVNMDDVLNNETGAIIRARAPGMVTPLAEPFVGQNAMPLIAYMDDVRAQRTGISAASQGLNPDVLQSTTKAAVTATVQGAQERIELVARLFAEQGMKRLFKGLLKLLIRHQNAPRVVKLRGKWVSVDPRYWDADMDVKVNVALGHGTDSDKMQFLMLVAQKQEQIMQTLGPNNPLVDVSQYRNTLAQITNLAGFKDASRYFKPVDMQQVEQMMQQQSQSQPPDPQMMLVQIEAQKAQAKAASDQAQMQLDAQKMQMEDARERQNMQLDAMIKIAEIEAKYGTQVDIAQVEAIIKREQALEEARINAETQRQNAIVQSMTSQAPNA